MASSGVNVKSTVDAIVVLVVGLFLSALVSPFVAKVAQDLTGVEKIIVELIPVALALATIYWFVRQVSRLK